MLKIIFLGDKNVGKSTWIKKIDGNDNYDNNKESSTIGCEIYTNQVIHLENKNYQLQLWNMSCLEKYKLWNKIQYKGARGIILIFDLTNKESFKIIKTYLIEINEFLENIPIVLIGNKSDLENKVVKKEKVTRLLNKHKNMVYKEISAKNLENSKELIIELIRMILKLEEKENDKIVKNVRDNFYNKKNKKNKKKKCCN